MSTYRTTRGRCLPLGATATADGVNFALLCRHGTDVRIVLYALETEALLAEFPLHPRLNRTGDHWHIQIAGLPPAFCYGWRVDGPSDNGNRFDSSLVLLDPSATAVSDGAAWGAGARVVMGRRGTSQGTTRRSVFVRRPFDWRGDGPPLTPLEDSIIYELHVRGFTCHPTSLVAHPGTFKGLIERIPYLQGLGITAIELLPVHEFDEDDCVFSNPLTGERLRNFWGYNSIAFAAPKAAYAASARDYGQVAEFRELVRTAHAAGIEVILDVVFNHTGEGDERGRTYSFRGLDNSLYYMLGPGGAYLNFSGCGNTVNCNHPVVRDQIVACLRFWVAEMHVDGLRFDLASVFGRDSHGNVMAEPPIVESIVEDGVLAHTKLIAEPWDAVGLYQVGRFPYGRRWSEWNGRYRDDVRRFWRGDAGLAGDLATRLCGSADLYEATGRLPQHTINFISCHDGFTLWDLVSYNDKHNEANGEDNRDGASDNFSWNCGIEGPTDDPKILELRRRQAKNLMTTLLLSQGVPMILAGDEFLRSQRGNNNAWCQDNELSWIDWALMESNADFLRYVRMLIALRKRHPALRRRAYFKGPGEGGSLPPDVIWHGVLPYQPDFSAGSRTLAYSLDGSMTEREHDCDLYVAINGWQERIDFTIPHSPSGQPWRRLIDTVLAAPRDIVELEEGLPVAVGGHYPVAARSMLVLAAAGLADAKPPPASQTGGARVA
jgi:glycogen operon protein